MCLSVVVVLAALGAEPEVRGPLLGVRCGRIVIEGNTDTPDRVVLDLLDLVPGRRVRLGSIPEARQRLRACPAFRANPWRGVGPVVELVPPGFESEFWDVYVRVVDRPGSWLGYSLSDLLWSAAYGVVLREPEPFRRELEYIVERLAGECGRGPRAGPNP